jgi:membrane-bound metal-dependent hydrolase YbcI (DUF457 family)
MFLGHFAVGLAAKRAAPSVSLGTLFLSAQFVDLLWPLFLLGGLEHVRIAPGITAFTPLDFYDYPITHSLVGVALWAALLAGAWYARRRRVTTAFIVAAAVLSHWLLDALTHRPDVPVLPGGPFVGAGLWRSVPATLLVELTMFAAAVLFYVRGGFAGARRVSFWLLIAGLLAAYVGAAFGPPPPDVTTLAVSALGVWVFVLWGWWADRR